VSKTRKQQRAVNFGVKTIEKLQPERARYNVRDIATRGLFICVFPSGAKSFFHLKKLMGYPKRTTIGPYPDLSVEQARGKASELNGKIALWKANDFQGHDPLQPRNKNITLGETLDHYVEHHLKKNAKDFEKASKYARWQFAKYLTAWRNRPLGTITRKDVAQRHAEIAEANGGVTANRTITFLRTLFNHAIDADYALWNGANPAAKPKKLLVHESARKRVIGDDDAPKFFKALETERNRDLRDVLLLALSTSARRGTILAMRWSEIDFHRELWTISKPKGRLSQAQEYIVPLNKLAMNVLKQRFQAGVETRRDRTRRAERVEWVFEGRRGHLQSVKKPWRNFLERAGIENLTLHDLRRTIATRQGEAGSSTEIIAKSLGHANDSTATKIYDRADRRDDVRESLANAFNVLVSAGKTTQKKLLLAVPRE